MMGWLRSLPGSAVAVGAFVLTVLLGLGGASASALWQQSATATMSVTASGGWPGPAITSLTCTNDSPQKVATLRIAVPKVPATITYAALQANGAYGTSYAGPSISAAATPGTITLDAGSQIIRDNPGASRLTLRVTATYTADQTQASADAVLTLDPLSSSGKIYCS